MRMVSIYILEILATYSSSDHRLYQKEIQGYVDGHKGVYLIENKFKESAYR